MPVTRPDVFTVAILVLLLLQVPPEVALLNCVLALAHTVVVPLMAETTGNGLTVTAVAEEIAVQPLALVTPTV